MNIEYLANAFLTRSHVLNLSVDMVGWLGNLHAAQFISHTWISHKTYKFIVYPPARKLLWNFCFPLLQWWYISFADSTRTCVVTKFLIHTIHAWGKNRESLKCATKNSNYFSRCRINNAKTIEMMKNFAQRQIVRIPWELFSTFLWHGGTKTVCVWSASTVFTNWISPLCLCCDVAVLALPRRYRSRFHCRIARFSLALRRACAQNRIFRKPAFGTRVRCVSASVADERWSDSLERTV